MLIRALALLLIFTLLEEAGAPQASSKTGVSSSAPQGMCLADHQPPATNRTKVLVKVRVMDDKTTPLVNATVRLMQNGSLPRIAASGITDQDGYVVFYVPSSVYSVEVQRSSIFEKPSVNVVTISSNTSLGFQLKDQENEDPALSTAAFLGILLSALVIMEAARLSRRSENRSKETVSERLREP